MEQKNAPSWYEQLPDPIRKNALKSLKSAKNVKLFPSLESALLGAFSWETSKMGYAYWESVLLKLKEGKLKLK